MSRQRVAITGIGMVTPLGLTAEETWKNILAGKSGVHKITEFNVTDYSTQIWAKVKNFNIENYVSAKDSRKMDLFTQYGIAAAEEAMIDSGLVIDEPLSLRAGVAVGSGIGGIDTITANFEKLLQGGPRKVSPFLSQLASSIWLQAKFQLSINSKALIFLW